jgi:hypothetical protein
MPAMAQQAVNWTHLTIENSTMLPCIGHPHVQLIDALKLHSASMFSAIVHPFNMTLSTRVCKGSDPTSPSPAGPDCATGSFEVIMGYYRSPEMHMNKGYNKMNQTVDMYVVNNTVLLSAFSVPLLYGQTSMLSVYSNDVSVSVFGIKLSKLKLRYDMTCTSLGMSSASPDPKICVGGTPGQARRLQATGPMMSCTPGQNVSKAGLSLQSVATIFA